MCTNQEIDEALDILKLGRESSLADIKTTFRKLALKYHPDKCCETRKKWCHKKFIKINSARIFLEECYTGGHKNTRSEDHDKRVQDYKDYIEHIERFYSDMF